MKDKRYTILSIMFILIISCFPNIIYADAAPKPSLDIIVKGMDGDYWLDLLVKDDSEHSWLDISDEERVLVRRLAEYQDDEGFHPALLGGTRVPLTGNIRGERQPDNTYIHQFSYVGTPEKFKIAILTEDDKLVISDIVHRKHFNSTVEFDISDEDLREDLILSAGRTKEVFPIVRAARGFAIRLVLTLIIEMGIALLFGFTLARSGKVLLMTNVFTQIILNIAILWMNLIYGLFGALAVFILMEILIIIFETRVYIKYITERTKARRIAYGIIANIISLIAGFWVNISMTIY